MDNFLKKIIEDEIIERMFKEDKRVDELIDSMALNIMTITLEKTPENEDPKTMLKMTMKMLEHVAARIDEYLLYMDDMLPEESE